MEFITKATGCFQYRVEPYLKFVWVGQPLCTLNQEKCSIWVMRKSNQKLLLRLLEHYSHSKFKPDNLFLQAILY
jgi:hypothetical protein